MSPKPTKAPEPIPNGRSTTFFNVLQSLLSWIIILSFIGWVSQSYAGCNKDVQKITPGQSSPCEGWLVSPSQMQEFAKTSDQLKLEQKINEVNKQLLTLSKTEVEFYKTRAKNSEKELSQSNVRQFWSTAGAFALGVILTGVAAKAAIEATK